MYSFIFDKLNYAFVNVAVTLIAIPIFIPRYGVLVAAQGAALGAIAGYLAVYVIRAINAQSYVKFKTQPIKLVVNSVLLTIQAVVMVFEIDGWIYYQSALFVAIVLLNIKPILEGIIPVLKRFVFKRRFNQ